jgi:hypothetical protein
LIIPSNGYICIMPPLPKAVMTADVVGSRAIPAAKLEAILSHLAKTIEGSGPKLFEFFRGDSFQALVEPADALKLALLWRSGLKAVPEIPDLDIRIAIGIGAVTHTGSSLGSSAGPAFEGSGILLDEMKKSDEARIAFHTEDPLWTSTLNTCSVLAEGLISRWTTAGAETIFQMLMGNETQEVLAGRFGVSQPAIHKRLQAANWTAVKNWEDYFRNTAVPALTRIKNS